LEEMDETREFSTVAERFGKLGRIVEGRVSDNVVDEFVDALRLNFMDDARR
jgi:hypothetical protein